MGFYSKEEFPSEDSPEITKEMAEKLLMKLFSLKKGPSLPKEMSKLHEDSNSACAHIGEYIHDLMFEQNYSSVDITIIKDEDNQLVFNLNKTEL
jgi:hypothetical protein